MDKKQTKKLNIKMNWTFVKFVFLSILKKPYIFAAAGAYLIFLLVMLVIVPAVTHNEPLYAWSATFNVPVFNLVFIAIINAAMIVGIFKIPQDEQTDLTLSAKPLNKTSMILIKIICYLIVSLIINGLCVAVGSITRAFGWYSSSNPTGITPQNYYSLLLSIFLGNLVCMLLFGAIALIISVYGPIIVVMVATIGISIFLSVANFILPRVATTQSQSFANKYGLEISSYSTNTSSQYINGKDTDELLPINYATIFSQGENKNFDTYEYWTNSSNSMKWLNYIDIGGQLSMLFHSFSLSDDEISRVSRLPIGNKIGYNYKIDKETGVKYQQLESLNYPIGAYTISQEAGMTFPKATIIASQLSQEFSKNWSLISPLLGFDFYAVNFVSTEQDKLMTTNGVSGALNNKTSYRMSELRLSKQQQTQAINLFNDAVIEFKNTNNFTDSVEKVISNDTSGLFFESGKWSELNLSQKFKVISQIQYFWAFYAQQNQIKHISTYNSSYVFPYTSTQLVDWYNNCALKPEQVNYYEQMFINNLYKHGLKIGKTNNNTVIYSLLLLQDLPYCESYSNLYQYHLDKMLDYGPVAGIWSGISVYLFVFAIIKLKRKDIM